MRYGSKFTIQKSSTEAKKTKTERVIGNAKQTQHNRSGRACKGGGEDQ